MQLKVTSKATAER